MARPLQIDLEDALCRVTSRGCERRGIVRDVGDREPWLGLFNWMAVRCG